MRIQSWTRPIVAAGLIAGAALLAVPAGAEEEPPTSTTVVTPEVEGIAARAQAAGAVAAPTLQVTPRTGLAATGQTVTVTGSGFDASRNGGVGVYVVFGPKEADFATNAETFKSAKWIHPGAAPSAGQGPLAADGSFTTTIDVVATYTTTSGRAIDCRATTCSVVAMAAHGVPDRSQDAQVTVTFAASGGPAATTSTTVRPSAAGATTTTTVVAPSSGRGTVVAGATETAASVSASSSSAAGATGSGTTPTTSLAQTGGPAIPLVVLGLLVAALGLTLTAVGQRDRRA